MAKYTINFGDGNIKETDNLGDKFEHTYTDGLSKHTVTVRGECGTFNAKLEEVQTTHRLDVTCDTTMGSVSGSGTYDEDSQVEVRCTPKPCYRFVQWSDGNTTNPRTINVDSDISLRAIMEIKKYTVKLSGSNCTFTGAGTYSCDTKVTISCKPADGYRFLQWEDGDTNPEKTFVIAKNHTHTATCEKVDGVICLPTNEHTYKFNNIGEFEIDTECNSLYVNMPTQRAWSRADFSAYITSDGNFVRSPKFIYNDNVYSYPNIEVIDAKKIMFKSGDKLTIKIKPTTTIKRIGQDPLIVMRLIGTDYKGVDDRHISEGVFGLDIFNKDGVEIKLTAYSDCVGFSIDFYDVIVDKELFDITITK